MNKQLLSYIVQELMLWKIIIEPKQKKGTPTWNYKNFTDRKCTVELKQT